MEHIQIPPEHYIHVTSEDKSIAPIVGIAVKILNDLAGEERIQYEIIEGTERPRMGAGVSWETVLVKTTFVGLGDPSNTERIIELHDAIGEVMNELHANRRLAEAYGMVIPAT